MDNQNICTNCSTLNTLDSLFCKHCGKAINSTLNNRINDEIDSLINVKKEQLEKEISEGKIWTFSAVYIEPSFNPQNLYKILK